MEKSYNPNKIPQFIGIFSQNEEQTKKIILGKVVEILEILIQHYPDDDQIQQNLSKLWQQDGFSFPNSHHITSLYLGGKPSESEYFKGFKENQQIDIEITSILYVPDNIICGTCFPDQQKIKIQNKVPHITMMIGQWKPVMSNAVLEAIMMDEKYLGKEYKNGDVQNAEQMAVKKFEQVEVKGKQTVYYIKLPKSLNITGITGGFQQISKNKTKQKDKLNKYIYKN